MEGEGVGGFVLVSSAAQHCLVLSEAAALARMEWCSWLFGALAMRCGSALSVEASDCDVGFELR